MLKTKHNFFVLSKPLLARQKDLCKEIPADRDLRTCLRWEQGSFCATQPPSQTASFPSGPIPCPPGGGWAVGVLFFLHPRRSQDGEPAACRGGARQRGLTPQSPTLLSQRQHLSNLRSHPEMKPRTMEGQATQEDMAAPWGYLWFLHGTERTRGIRRQPPLTCHFLYLVIFTT